MPGVNRLSPSILWRFGLSWPRNAQPRLTFSGLARESRPSFSVSRLSSFRRHSRALPGNPGHHSRCRAFLPFAVILGPCPGIQSFIAKNRTGFPPSARMTAGSGRVIPCIVRVFLFPSFSWPPRKSSPRPHSGFPPSARMTAGRVVYFCELNGAGFPPDGLGDGTRLDSRGGHENDGGERRV